MARYIQIGALLLALCAATALTAAIGADGGAPQEAEPAAEAATKTAAAATENDGEHVRDKRRLPDPGFIIPATPMGFSKNGQPAQQEAEREARAERQLPSAASSAATPAERKVSSPSLVAAASSAYGPRAAYSYADSVAAPSRQKKAHGVPSQLAAAKPVPGSREAPLGREEHVRALTSFLSQTRKLGVPDEQALKLLDKELAKAKRQGPAYRPVYHATPLKPYGALLNFNQTPYEKHQLKNMKPIKEQQNDIPPPSKPIVVESDRQILGAKATPSPAPIPGRHTEALVSPNGPLLVDVPRQIGPQHLQQPTQKLIRPQIVSGPLSGPQQAYQTISLPVANYKPEESYQTLQSLEHSQYLQAAPIQQTITIGAETPVSLEAVHSYPTPEQHSYPVPEQHNYAVPEQHKYAAPEQHSYPVPEQNVISEPQVTVQEVHQPRPVYVYRQEEVKIPQPEAELHHVELPVAPVVTKQVVHEAASEGGLYHDQKEQAEEYASQYRFGYRVRDQHDGSDFGHAETRDGKMTKGEYFVNLPDGRLQTVKYWADQGGYHAQISYTNHASHPAPAHPAH